MFYCSECAKKNDWPETFGQSYGPCELCKQTALCNDMSSSELPMRSASSVKNPPDSGNK